MNSIDVWSLWYEAGGLAKLKIEAFFTAFRIASIYLVTIIPFWVSFNRTNHDIGDAIFSVNLVGLWIFYTITYLIMAWFMILPLYKRVNRVIQNREMFDNNGINIDTTEGVDIDKLCQLTQTTKEAFLVEALKYDNTILALEDKKYLDSFTNLLSTFPLELTVRLMMDGYYFNNISWTFKNRDENTQHFKDTCRRCAFGILVFLPTLIVFSTVNHIFTYIHNGSYLSLYDYNRLGLWKFRYYNEFLFQTKKRLAKTKPSAEAVTVNLYLESWRSSFSKCISYMFSAFSAVLLVFSFFGYEWVWGMDLLPMTAIFGILANVMFPKQRNADGSMTTLRTALKKDLTRYELKRYFESKLNILFKEVISILAIPVILYFVLPEKSYFIADFMAEHYKEGNCAFAKWSNKDATSKTKASYTFVSQDIGNSDLISI